MYSKPGPVSSQSEALCCWLSLGCSDTVSSDTGAFDCSGFWSWIAILSLSAESSPSLLWSLTRHALPGLWDPRVPEICSYFIAKSEFLSIIWLGSPSLLVCWDVVAVWLKSLKADRLGVGLWMWSILRCSCSSWQDFTLDGWTVRIWGVWGRGICFGATGWSPCGNCSCSMDSKFFCRVSSFSCSVQYLKVTCKQSDNAWFTC